MALQDDIDQKVTDDVQKQMGRALYNNIILSAQVETLQAELARVYDQVNDLTAQAERAEAGTSGAEAEEPVEGEVVAHGEATAG